MTKNFPLWKRGTKGDSSFYKKERLEKAFPLWKRGTKGDSPQRKERDIHYFDVEYALRGLVLCEGENLSMKDCIFSGPMLL
ncbi:MAG: hypothetical protein B5M53_10890 [Candidatus Cloacimonas sp. 4484_209]|nr:MAG: hypothetical protein B5M53_10890 [Candidatus Cloacimonas sp. 4484_209]